MNLQRKLPHGQIRMGTILILILAAMFPAGLPLEAQNRTSQKPGLIRDTGVAEEEENASEVKEPDPLLCEKNLNVGDFYFKKKNYVAAIGRYLEAIEYQPDSVRAFESLARAYEKNKNTAKAIDTYQRFIKENPDSPKLEEFRAKLGKLKKSAR
jgi:tetratricopeptide (TPR) repeat protein